MGATKKERKSIIGSTAKKRRGRPPKVEKVEVIKEVRTMEYVKKVEELKMDGNLAENWRIFRQHFEIFATAIELEKKAEPVKVTIFSMQLEQRRSKCSTHLIWMKIIRKFIMML